MEQLPKDPDQRREWVKDRRRKRIQAEKDHRHKVKQRELDEISDNIDRAWSRQGTTHFNPVFAGFGAGQKGATGTWVFDRQLGKLVPK